MQESLAWAQYIEQWHDFFLMAGTAAVTLAGLLFVAISLHVETLVHESRQHLIDLSRATLMTFIMVLVLSLFMLAPGQSQRIVAFELMVLGVVFGAFTARLIFMKPPANHGGFSQDLFRRRLALPLFGYGWLALTGWLLMKGEPPATLRAVFAAVTVLLASAAGTSWDLLVRVARIKLAEAKKADAA